MLCKAFDGFSKGHKAIGHEGNKFFNILSDKVVLTNLPKGHISLNALWSYCPIAFKKAVAFTLAEVLIVLGIIGVVAALTIPTLMKNYEKKVTITKLRKVYSILNQAVLRSAADNGPMTEFLPTNEVVNTEMTRNFVNTYWLPYFKSPKTYNCGKLYSSAQPYKRLNDGAYTTYIGSNDTARVLFQTEDGIIYFISFLRITYVQNASGNQIRVDRYSSTQLIIVDINGTNKPNVIGKDVFIFTANMNKNNVLPYGFNESMASINNSCKKNGTGDYCMAKIVKDGWQIKSNYPW